MARQARGAFSGLPSGAHAALHGSSTSKKLDVEVNVFVVWQRVGWLVCKFARCAAHVSATEWRLLASPLLEMASWRASITKDDVDALRVALGGSVDIVDDYSSRTPLRQAAFENKLGCVRWLIEAGADVNAVNSEKWSALHLSIWRDNAAVAEMLLRAGADASAKISSDHPPLALCFQRDARSCARLLLDRGITHGLPDEPPPWVQEFLVARERCRHAALLVVGIHRMRRSSIMVCNGRDAIRIVAGMVWGTRLTCCEWNAQPTAAELPDAPHSIV